MCVQNLSKPHGLQLGDTGFLTGPGVQGAIKPCVLPNWSAHGVYTAPGAWEAQHWALATPHVPELVKIVCCPTEQHT